VVPFMDWEGFKPPRQTPEEVKAAIAELELRAHDQRSYLEAVYELVLDKTLHQYKHTRFKAAFYIPRAFVSDLSEIWQTHDFLYCTGINYLLYVLLIKSKYFKPEDVRVKHVFVNFFIHQYLQVRIGDRYIDVDPAGTGIRGKPLGTYLRFFG
jgi:hypothetical protein